MAAAGQAVPAAPTDDVALAGDHIADLQVGDVVAEGGHGPHELVPDGHGDRDDLLGPRVPVPNVDVGAADRRLVDLDQDVVDPDAGDRDLIQPQPRLPLLLHQGLHGLLHVSPSCRAASYAPHSFLTSANISTAKSISSTEWAADTCTRMRAAPLGTTG